MSLNRLNRRTFLQSTALGAAVIAAPSVLRAQGAPVKVGILHPVSGALSYSGQQGRLGAQMAVDAINAAGGIKALGGAKIEAILGDAQSTPEGGNAEVEKMNSAGVSAIVGGYASSICLSASQTAARYDLPYVVDVGVVDSIVTRGLKNTFRFGPGFGVIAKTALDNLVAINEAAGKPAKTVMIVHEDSAFGAGLAKLLNAQLPERGFQILETIAHPTPTRDFNNVALKIKAQNPDIVIPANYYNEYVLLARTMQQQRIRPKGIYSVLGGAASSYKFVKEFPDAAEYIMDCNHWFDPKNPKAQELKKQVEAKGQFYTYEVYMNYSCVLLLADAIERAASTDRAKIIGALESSTFSGHVMPYGPTKFVNGQNQGAAPVNTQVLKKDIEVILPAAFASAKAVFPMPRA
ncbi:MAG: ABC transporter substrate-binding protein [Rhizobiales bacterium]|nr:ABC transporter substrate-binding protein [Hyphomicrobiales bacterium]OJY45079.1 MAG: ABC transporter substrate-binding protein [Rhizobiales bacterium 64-17]